MSVDNYARQIARAALGDTDGGASKLGHGWTTIVDEVWIGNEIVNSGIKLVPIPEKYQIPITDFRILYLADTPLVGSKYTNDTSVTISLKTSGTTRTLAKADGFFPTESSQDETIDWIGTGAFVETGVAVKNPCVAVEKYDDRANVIISKFIDSNDEVYHGEIPTSGNLPIVGGSTYMPNGEPTRWNIDSYLANRTHKITLAGSVYTIKTNDYYNSENPSVIFSQVLESEFTAFLKTGTLFQVGIPSQQYIAGINYKFEDTAPVSYKNKLEILGSVIDENMTVHWAGKCGQNTLTSFNQVDLPISTANTIYSNSLQDATPLGIQISVPSSTSNGTTANMIYAGSRLVVQVK